MSTLSKIYSKNYLTPLFNIKLSNLTIYWYTYVINKSILFTMQKYMPIVDIPQPYEILHCMSYIKQWLRIRKKNECKHIILMYIIYMMIVLPIYYDFQRFLSHAYPDRVNPYKCIAHSKWAICTCNFILIWRLW
jgi:hypothetical protein